MRFFLLGIFIIGAVIVWIPVFFPPDADELMVGNVNTFSFLGKWLPGGALCLALIFAVYFAFNPYVAPHNKKITLSTKQRTVRFKKGFSLLLPTLFLAFYFIGFFTVVIISELDLYLADKQIQTAEAVITDVEICGRHVIGYGRYCVAIYIEPSGFKHPSWRLRVEKRLLIIFRLRHFNYDVGSQGNQEFVLDSVGKNILLHTYPGILYDEVVGFDIQEN